MIVKVVMLSKHYDAIKENGDWEQAEWEESEPVSGSMRQLHM